MGRIESDVYQSHPCDCQENNLPVHLTSQTRRQFIGTVGVALVAGAGRGFADERFEDDLVNLLNDTHISEKHPSSSPVPTHLRQVVTELVERERKPAAMLINGVLTLKDGQPAIRFPGHVRPPQARQRLWRLPVTDRDSEAGFGEVIIPETRPVC